MQQPRCTVPLILVFLASFSVLAFEMLLPRLISPYFGSSHWVWAVTITLVLLGLSVGYHIGGFPQVSAACRLPRTWGAIALTIALAFWLEPWLVKMLLSTLLDGLINHRWIEAGAILIALILFLVGISALLVVYSPALYTMLSQERGVSMGKLFIISTLGSVLGVILQSTVLITVLGTNYSHYLLGAFWLIFGLVALAWRPGRIAFIALPALVVVLVTTFQGHPGTFELNRTTTRAAFGPDFGHLLLERESHYQLIRVYFSPLTQRADIMLNEPFVTHSSWYAKEPYRLRAASYFHMASLVPALVDVAPSEMRAVNLGAAAGSIPRLLHKYYPGIKIDAVDIDGEVFSVGEKTFGPLPDGGSIRTIVDDARLFMRRSNVLYDFILVDAYASGIIPAHLATAEFFALLDSKLSSGGMLALNVPYLSDSDPLLSSIVRTLEQRFSHFYVNDRGKNRVLIAARTPLKLETSEAVRRAVGSDFSNLIDSFFNEHFHSLPKLDRSPAPLLTDDHAPVEWLSLKSYLNYFS